MNKRQFLFAFRQKCRSVRYLSLGLNGIYYEIDIFKFSFYFLRDIPVSKPPNQLGSVDIQIKI